MTRVARTAIGNIKGYTLTELIVVMAIFIGIIIIAANAFETILGKAAQNTKRTESNIEGIVGLELLRSDLEHAGYGLPWSFQNTTPIPYEEVKGVTTANGIDPSTFNDKLPTAPRPIILGYTTKEVSGISGLQTGGIGPDYLVIKSTVVALNNTAKKWSYINYTAAGSVNKSYIRKWGSADDVANKDHVITIKSTFTTSGEEDKNLVMSGNQFYYTVNGVEPVDDAFKPGDATQTFIVYGINNIDGKPLSVPYNRADFYIAKPDDPGSFPKACNPGTGILYKAVANNNGDGSIQRYPLLDCVGDMQVVFVTDGGGRADVLPGDAAGIRTFVKEVKVFILAHEGKLDRNFTYPNSTIDLTDGNLGRIWTADNMQKAFGSNWRNYRWKVYTIVARPKNLN